MYEILHKNLQARYERKFRSAQIVNAELAGVVMGDGYIDKNFKKYRIGFVGHPITDKEYFEYLKGLIKTEWGKEAKSSVRMRGLRMVISSKQVCNFLTNDLKIPYGRGKSKKIEIPQKILSNWELTVRLSSVAESEANIIVGGVS
jgi:hypothetical protein